MGLNRTGTEPVWQDAKASERREGDLAALAELRKGYLLEAEAIGSVPSVVGDKLDGDRPALFLDKLGERLAFERTGIRLYDALITRIDVAGPCCAGVTRAELLKMREDELRHLALLANALVSIGGDPAAQTPSADVAGVEASGLMLVLTDPRTTFAQALHAILVAEMIDNNGWDHLITLAQDHGQEGMASGFEAARNEERGHLHTLERWLEEETLGAGSSRSPRFTSFPASAPNPGRAPGGR